MQQHTSKQVSYCRVYFILLNRRIYFSYIRVLSDVEKSFCFSFKLTAFINECKMRGRQSFTVLSLTLSTPAVESSFSVALQATERRSHGCSRR